MNKAKNAFSNSFFSLVNQLVSMVIGLILPRIKLVYFGSEINGLLASIQQFIGYIMIIEAGLQVASGFELFKPLAEEDSELTDRLMSTIKRQYQKIAIFFTAISLAIAFVYPLIINGNQLGYLQTVMLFVVLAFAKSIDFFISTKYIIILTSNQKARVSSIINIFSAIIKAALIILLSVLRFNIIIVYSVMVLSSFFTAFCLKVYCSKNYPNITYKKKPQPELLKKRYSVFGVQIATLIYNSALITIASFVLLLPEISVYSVYALITANVGGMIFILSGSIAPAFGEIIAKKDEEGLSRNFSLFDTTFSMLSVIVYSCIGILVVSFVRLYTAGIEDADYYRPTLALLMTACTFIGSMSTPMDVVANSSGFYKEQFKIAAVQAAIMVLLGIVLVFLLKMEGLVIACIVAWLYKTSAMIYLIKKKVKVISTRRIIIHRIVQAFTFLCLVIPFYFYQLVAVDYFIWVLYGAITFVGVSLFSILVYFALLRKDFMLLLDWAKQFLMSKRKRKDDQA